MKATEPTMKGERNRAATHIAGVENRQPYFIPGHGTVEAESLEEAIKQVKEEEVENGN